MVRNFGGSIPFDLMVNVNFWNYYIPLRAHARQPPFNHLDSTSLEPTFLRILTYNCHFSLLSGRTTMGEARRNHECAILPNIPTPETSVPTPSTIYPLPRLDPCSAAPFRIAARHWRNVLPAFREIVSPCIHLVFPQLLPLREREDGLATTTLAATVPQTLPPALSD